MIKKGVYAAGLSVLNTDRTLNIDATINHATQAIQNGLQQMKRKNSLLRLLIIN